MLDLSWLPAHPALGSAITSARGLANAGERLDMAIRLAGFRRDGMATARIDRLAQEALADMGAPQDCQRRRLAILGSSTVDMLIPAVRAAALSRRLILEVISAPYGQVRQAILDPVSPLAAAQPDFVLLTLDEAAVLPPMIGASAAEAGAALQAEIDSLIALWSAARQRFGATVVQQTILNTRLGLFGSYDAAVASSPAAMIDKFNRGIVEAAQSEGVLLVDLDAAARWSGRANWHDTVRWHGAKQAIAPAAIPLYGELAARVIAAACGLSRKCLVLDLDNTLWGGVVGDDGSDGIILGQGSAAGEAYVAFQRYVAALAQRGVILALCSKNDSDIVEQVFSSHPEMLLKREQIAAAAINWTDKATNLRQLAATLDLGLDSLVFVDDNPAEREIVRRELPMVAVPEMPDDIADYPATLASAGYFEAVTFTAEDRARVQQYAANSKRNELLAAATDIDGFLQSLDMRLDARTPSKGDLARVTQLINRSNQFNLTTRRYSAEEVERAVNDSDVVLLGFRLVDKFGDNGLIAVIIARPDERQGHALRIDTWLMSCRVLGRGVEVACLRVLAAEARRRGVDILIGEYRPTSRNAMVGDHFARLGFQPDGRDGQTTFWRLDLAQFIEPECHIRINHEQHDSRPDPGRASGALPRDLREPQPVYQREHDGGGRAALG